jgi:hypothetical protein
LLTVSTDFLVDVVLNSCVFLQPKRLTRPQED